MLTWEQLVEYWVSKEKGVWEDSPTSVFDTSLIPVDSSDESVKFRILLADYLKAWQKVTETATMPEDSQLARAARDTPRTGPYADKPKDSRLRGDSQHPSYIGPDGPESEWQFRAGGSPLTHYASIMPLSQNSNRDPYLWVSIEAYDNAAEIWEDLQGHYRTMSIQKDMELTPEHIINGLHPDQLAKRIDSHVINHIDDENWTGISSVPLIKHGKYEPTRVLHSDKEDTVWRGATEDGSYQAPFASVTPPWEEIRKLILKGTPQKEIINAVLTKSPGEFAEIVQGYLREEPYPNSPTGATPQLHKHIIGLLRQATLLNPEGVQMLLSGEYLDREDGLMKSLPKQEHEKILKYLPDILNSSRNHERMLGKDRVQSPKKFLKNAMFSAVKRIGTGEGLNKMNVGWGGTLSPMTNMLLQQRYGAANFDDDIFIPVNPDNDQELSDLLTEIFISDPRTHDQIVKHLYFDRTPLGPDAKPIPPRPLASKDPSAVTYVPEIIRKNRGIVSQNLNSKTMTEDEKALKLMDIHTNLDQAMIEEAQENYPAGMTEAEGALVLGDYNVVDEIRNIIGDSEEVQKSRAEILQDISSMASYQSLGSDAAAEISGATSGGVGPYDPLKDPLRTLEDAPLSNSEASEFSQSSAFRGEAAIVNTADEYRRNFLDNMSITREAKDPDDELVRQTERDKKELGAGMSSAYLNRPVPPSAPSPKPEVMPQPVREWLRNYKFRHNKPGATQGWADIKTTSKAEARTLPSDYLKRNPVPRGYTPNETASIEAVQAWTDILNNLK